MAGLTGIVVLASTNETEEEPPKRSSEKSGSDAKFRPDDREDEDDEVPEDLIGRRGRDPDDGPHDKADEKTCDGQEAAWRYAFEPLYAVRLHTPSPKKAGGFPCSSLRLETAADDRSFGHGPERPRCLVVAWTAEGPQTRRHHSSLLDRGGGVFFEVTQQPAGRNPRMPTRSLPGDQGREVECLEETDVPDLTRRCFSHEQVLPL